MAQDLDDLETLRAPSSRHAHIARFYESDAMLVREIRSFLSPALASGAPALLLATAGHCYAVEAELRREGIDLEAAEAEGRYVALDAEEVLGRLLVYGAVDPVVFEAEIGGLLDGVARHGTVHAFGELVALLWERGDVSGAIRVEELWNELALEKDFTLLCGYPMRNFESHPDPAGFEEVCRQHSEIVPAESYPDTRRSEAAFRRVVALEQTLLTGRLESEALRLKQSQLEDALRRVGELERMRREFVAMAVHDIRGPAAVVTGFLQVLRKNRTALDDVAIDALLDKATRQTLHIQDLAGDMLTIAELDSVGFGYDIEAFDLPDAIREAVHAVAATDDAARIDVRVPSLVHPALGDRRRQIQVIGNLLSNALKFSLPDRRVVIAVAERSDELVVNVTDEGVGLSSEDIAKLFRPFVRLRPPGFEAVRGTGLGLYICKLLVQGQKGTIGIDSSLGRGTTVWFTIPRSRPL